MRNEIDSDATFVCFSSPCCVERDSEGEALPLLIETKFDHAR